MLGSPFCSHESLHIQEQCSMNARCNRLERMGKPPRRVLLTWLIPEGECKMEEV